jgi:hypothetical protein
VSAGVNRVAVSWRSVLLGLVGAGLICGVSPYNDYVLNNTFLVGNNLPLAVVVLLFVWVLGVNAPLLRWRPGWALSMPELALASSMWLVACAIPGSGLMRYFPATLVGPWYQARGGGDYLSLLTSLGLPGWLFPKFSSGDPSNWPNDPVVVDFMGRYAPLPGAPLSEHPVWAWVRPGVMWFPFLAALATAIGSLMLITRKQWVDNERLPFPLAQIPLSLIEAPAPGQVLNSTLRSRLFWAGLLAVFCLHVWNGMGLYLPRYVPRIPVAYDLSGLFAEPPLNYVDQKLKEAGVFFTVVGVTYFLNSSISFSLWAFFIGYQVVRVIQGTATGDPTVYGQQDQHLGGVLAYLVMLIYVGRRHYLRVLRQAFVPRAHRHEPRRFLSYRTAVWMLVGSVGVMTVWLRAAGCEWVAALVMVSVLLATFLVIARVIAETGLVHGQLIVPVYKPWQLLSWMGLHNVISTRSFYLGAMLQATHYDMREPLSVYASHALKIIPEPHATAEAALTREQQHARHPHSPIRSGGGRLLGALAMALLVGFVVSYASTLMTEYRYSATLDTPPHTPLNVWGAETNPRLQILDATIQYDRNYYFPSHSPVLHIGLGFLITAGLSLLRFRFAGFPLHPVGFLMIGTYPGAHLWLSIFIGWAAKQVALKLGGTHLYVKARPVFLGLVVGESLAAAFWMLSGVVLTQLNIPYRVVNIMPG